MCVEMQRLRMPFSFTNLKKIFARAMEYPLYNKLRHRPLALIVWVDLDEGFWPIAPISVLPINFIPNIWRSNLGKTS